MNSFYKLGAAKAVSQFMADLSAMPDNPTAHPPMKMAGQRAVDKILREVPGNSGGKRPRPRTISRVPVTKTTNLKKMKNRIRKTK